MRVEIRRDEVGICKDGTVLAIINQMYGVPLYAWYVVEVEVYWPDDIEGTLMSPPFEIHGPFVSRADARKLVEGLYHARRGI